MTPMELKHVKKGDVFYEQVKLHRYKFEALEDCCCKDDMEIQGKMYKQYTVLTCNEFKEERYLLVTERLPHYSSKYFKQHGNDRPAV